MILTARARWLAAAVVAGAATSHLLDELGALPGVHESAAVRFALLDPGRASGIVLVLLATLFGGLLADLAFRRGRSCGVLALIACQFAASAGLESVARARLEAELLNQRGLTAVLVQSAIALGVLALLTVAAALWRGLASPSSASVVLLAPLAAHVNAWAGTPRVPCQGRAPPRTALRVAT